MAKSNSETILWSLFAAGGVLAAMFVPALIFVTGIALPFVDEGALERVHVPFGWLQLFTTNILSRLLLFLIISLTFFHCANRFFHTIKDLGIHGARGLVALLCYGGAIVGTGFAVWVVLL